MMAMALAMISWKTSLPLPSTALADHLHRENSPRHRGQLVSQDHLISLNEWVL
jgi:hypothetical protein